jgi:hypothetical protein
MKKGVVILLVSVTEVTDEEKNEHTICISFRRRLKHG